MATVTGAHAIVSLQMWVLLCFPDPPEGLLHFLKFILVLHFMLVSVSPVCRAHGSRERAWNYLQPVVSWVLVSSGCWELNLGLLEEQPVCHLSSLSTSPWIGQRALIPPGSYIPRGDMKMQTRQQARLQLLQNYVF